MKTSKKILFVGSYPPPFGGIASHLTDLFEIYEKQQTDFYVFDVDKVIKKTDKGYLHLRSLDKNLDILLKPVYFLTIARYLVGLIKSGFFLLAFVRSGTIGLKTFLRILFNLVGIIITIKELKLQVISAYHIFPEGVYPYLIKRNFFPDLEYALTVFGELQADTVMIDKHKAAYHDMLQKAALTMASSQYCANGVEKVNFSPNRVQVVYYGIKLEHYRRRGEYTEGSRENGIIFVGHINKRMGLESLADALEILRDERRIRINARIVGNDHGYLRELEEIISRRGLNDQMRIFQRISNDELRDFYDSSYMYVNTMNTRLPCMGLSMKEAMANELPVIASDAGGIPEGVVDNETGFVFEANNARQLAGYIEKLYGDFQMAREFGKEGHKRALEVFDSRKSSEKVIGLLKKL